MIGAKERQSGTHWFASARGLAPFSETDGAKGLVSQIGVAPYTVTGLVVRPAA